MRIFWSIQVVALQEMGYPNNFLQNGISLIDSQNI